MKPTRARNLVVFVGATLLFVLLVFRSHDTSHTHEELVENQEVMVKAARDIPEGTPLSSDDIRFEKVPVAFLPPAPIYEHDVGRFLNEPANADIPQGALLLVSDFDVEE